MPSPRNLFRAGCISLALITVSVVANAGTGFAQSKAAPTPAEVLLKSMQRQTSVNVLGIITQRDGAGTGITQTIRVERDRNGRSHFLVLAPLRHQGTESVDNGARSLVYWPDKNVIIDQDSPSKTPCDAQWRMTLAQKNYRLKFGTPLKIAGRTTRCIEATPIDPRMEVRRFYVDATTSYPLRLELIGSNRTVVTIQDTKEISYPVDVTADRFVLKPVGAPRTLKFERPKSTSAAQVERALGFEPIIPKVMPMGFAMQDMQVTQSDRWRSVAIRVTDGLVRGTVYQWRSRGEDREVEGMDENSVMKVGDVRMMIVSDLDASRRQAMLEAFVESALAEGLLDLSSVFLEPDPICRRFTWIQSRYEDETSTVNARHSLRKETTKKT
jgi:hypothetical protein